MINSECMSECMCVVVVHKNMYLFTAIHNVYDFPKSRMTGHEIYMSNLRHKSKNINLIAKKAHGGRFK